MGDVYDYLEQQRLQEQAPMIAPAPLPSGDAGDAARFRALAQETERRLRSRDPVERAMTREALAGYRAGGGDGADARVARNQARFDAALQAVIASPTTALWGRGRLPEGAGEDGTPPADRRRWVQVPGFEPSRFLDGETGEIWERAPGDRGYRWTGSVMDPMIPEIVRRAAALATLATRRGERAPAVPTPLPGDRFRWQADVPSDARGWDTSGGAYSEGAWVSAPTDDDVARYSEAMARVTWTPVQRRRRPRPP
jgi:hypothetical protein